MLSLEDYTAMHAFHGQQIWALRKYKDILYFEETLL